MLVFWNIPKYGFNMLDDNFYVTDNPAVLSGLNRASAAWAFNTTYYGNWHPLTWLSHMLDVQLYGLNAHGHHITTLVLHIINAALLFLVLNRMSGAFWRSLLVAALFAVHPLNVETASFIGERKGILSTTFWMLTLLSYCRYVELKTFSIYVLVIIFMGLGLMAKQMPITLPLILLVLDYWPLKRFDVDDLKSKRQIVAASAGLIKEKIPLFALSVIFSFIAYLAQKRGGALNYSDTLAAYEHVLNALASYNFYILKTLVPTGLSIYYPQSGTPHWNEALLYAAALSIITILAALSYRRRPYFLAGWLWYAIALIPVSQLVHIGRHAMADHYAYVPVIGLFIVIAWGGEELFRKFSIGKPVTIVSTVILLSVLMYTARAQTGYWKDNLTLFGHAAGVTKGNYLAHNYLGIELYRQGRMDEAYFHFSRALELSPYDMDILNHMGVVSLTLGKTQEAVGYFNAALRINPAQRIPQHLIPLIAGVHYNLAVALEKQGDLDGAIEHFKTAASIKPGYQEAILGFLKAMESKERAGKGAKF
jgi:tetratricopeptide (TPR) repeat protein